MKKNKILKILFSDIEFDAKEQSLILNRSCQRSPIYHIGGVVVGDKALFISLEELAVGHNKDFVETQCSKPRTELVTGDYSELSVDERKVEPTMSKVGKYHIVPMDSEFDEDVASDLNNRFYAGFILRSGFRIGNSMWAIFEEVAD
ncbi:hypothetical protein AAEX28_13175 [Lentisphaerota bacterium WC36G]|nr:hypothetical protein LJT99_16005 [Lentisphaerae bacterium WC36]